MTLASIGSRNSLASCLRRSLSQNLFSGPPGLSRSLLIFASGDCGVILCDSLGGRLLLGFEITEG